MSVVIETKNISFAYPESAPVLSGITLSIAEGATALIIGPNGSGKTTLLKIMAGLLVPKTGSVTVCGMSPEKAHANIGYVPQRLDFDRAFPLTVLELLRYSRPEVSTAVCMERLSHLHIAHLANHRIGTLSGGELQRALITRALLHDPKVLFFDEPVSGIDVGGEQTFYDLVAEVKKKHAVTVVMVSHEIDMVHSIATQVICLNKSLLCSGVPEESLTPDILAKLYGHGAAPYHHH